MALFLALALATVAVTGALARQDAWLREIQLSRDSGQARLLAQGAFDWAREILIADARVSTLDHLGEPWAVRLPPVSAEGGEVEGRLDDMQALWNLNNLVLGATEEESAVARRVFRLSGLPMGLTAGLTAQLLDSGRLLGRGDALALPNAASISQLKACCTALPEATAVNANTASAEVLAAVLDVNLTLARRLVAERERRPLRDAVDLRQRLGEDPGPGVSRLSFNSRYFMVTVRVHHGAAYLQASSLLRRSGGAVDLVWQRWS